MARRPTKTSPQAEEIDLEVEPPASTSTMPRHDAGASYASAIGRLPDPVKQPLVDLLAPHDVGTFFREYWDERVLHIRNHGAPQRFGKLLSFDALLSLFRHNRVQPQYARFSRKDGSSFNDARLRDAGGKGLFLFDAVFDFLQRGSGSVVLNHLNDYHPSANRLVNSLAEIFCCVVKVNAYFSARESRLFPLHWDTHDTFILQAEGTKEWHVYEPVVRLPLEDRHSSEEFSFTAKGRRKLIMRPGDVLFVPRGAPHQAFAKKTDSLHLTVGLYVPTWVSIVEGLVRRATAELARDAHARGSSALLLATPHEQRRSVSYASRVVGQFVKTLRGLDMRATLLEAAAAQRIVTCPEGVDLSRSAPVELESRIVRYPCLYFLVDGPRGPTLLFDKKKLVFERSACEALRFITERRTFVVSEMPRPTRNIAIVTRLIADGFLHVANRAAARPLLAREPARSRR